MCLTPDVPQHWNVATMDYFDLQFWFARAIGEEAYWMQDPSCRSLDPLTGDQAVCLITVRIVDVQGDRCWELLPNYSDEWAEVGPRINDLDIELVALERHPDRGYVTQWRARAMRRPKEAHHPHIDRLQLAAAMRCYVACKFGDTFTAAAHGPVARIDIDEEGYPLYE